MSRSHTRHYGASPCRRTYTDAQIAEMETMRYRLRMSFAAISKEFPDSTSASIEKQLCSNGNYYGDDRPLKAKPFDGWNFSDMDVVV